MESLKGLYRIMTSGFVSSLNTLPFSEFKTCVFLLAPDLIHHLVHLQYISHEWQVSAGPTSVHQFMRLSCSVAL